MAQTWSDRDHESLGMDRVELIKRLMANVTDNPAARGMVPTSGGRMTPMRQLPPGSFNPGSPAGIERQAFTGRSPFAGGQPNPAMAQFLHAALAAEAMNQSNPGAGPSYGGSHPMNPVGAGNVTAGGLLTGDASKQKNPLQQVGSAIKSLVSYLIER